MRSTMSKIASKIASKIVSKIVSRIMRVPLLGRIDVSFLPIKSQATSSAACIRR
jgi:hypothetical protein